MLFCCIYSICLFGKHCELGLAHKLARQKWQNANHSYADTVSGTAYAEANLSTPSRPYTASHNEHARQRLWAAGRLRNNSAGGSDDQ